MPQCGMEAGHDCAPCERFALHCCDCSDDQSLAAGQLCRCRVASVQVVCPSPAGACSPGRVPPLLRCHHSPACVCVPGVCGAQCHCCWSPCHPASERALASTRHGVHHMHKWVSGGCCSHCACSRRVKCEVSRHRCVRAAVRVARCAGPKGPGTSRATAALPVREPSARAARPSGNVPRIPHDSVPSLNLFYAHGGGEICHFHTLLTPQKKSWRYTGRVRRTGLRLCSGLLEPAKNTALCVVPLNACSRTKPHPQFVARVL
jgi:hypothetical protein